MNSDHEAQRRSRRVKALVRLEPLIDMIDASSRVWGNHQPHRVGRYDMRALAEAAIVAVVEQMGIHEAGGAPFDNVVNAVAQTALAMHPGDLDDARDVARWVVDWLINAAEGGRARTHRYTDPADGYAWHTLDVTVLYEELSPSGDEVVLRASSEAVNSLIVAFDLDLGDAQVAAEAILDVALASGNLDKAVTSARQASQTSRMYVDQLTGLLDRTRRDVTAVDWSDHVPALIDTARTHLSLRRRAEQTLLTSATGIRDEQRDPTRRRTAAEVVELVDGCLNRHDRLLTRLIDARQVFLDEQRRQRISVISTPAAISIPAELLHPLLAGPATEAEAPLALFTTVSSGPVAPRRHTLASLVDQLLAPRRGGAELDDLDDDTGELVAIPTAVAFDDATWEAARKVVETIEVPTRLSRLLVVARDAGTHDGLVALMVLAERTYGIGAARRIEIDGAALNDPCWGGDDLLVHPTNAEADGPPQREGAA